MRHKILVCLILVGALGALPGVAAAAKTPQVVIGSVTPSRAPGGATIVVAGTGLGASGGSVRFLRDLGSAASPKIVAWSATRITCVVPSITAHVHGLKVVTRSGATSNVLAFTIGAAGPAPAPLPAPTPSTSPTRTPTVVPTPTATPTPAPADAPASTSTTTPAPTPTTAPAPTTAPTPTATPAPTPTVTPSPTVAPAPDGAVFNVDDYGAVGNGTTDDSHAIQRAYNAAYGYSAGGAPSTVLFPAGTYYVATPWTLKPIRTNDSWNADTDAPSASPTRLCRGVVTFSGTGATIKYAKASTRFCWLQSPNPGGAGDTYGNLVIDGFTFDCNNRAPAGVCGSVLWVPGGANFSNITVRNCSTENVPPNSGGIAQYGAKPAGSIYCVDLVCGNAVGAYGQGLTVDNCDFVSSGQCVYVAGGPNSVLDQINQSNSTYDNQLWAGSNTMVGGSASGWRCSFTDMTLRNSLDDGIEVDAFCDVTITDCNFTVNRQAIALTRVAATAPYKNKPTVIHITGCVYSGALGRYWSQSANQQPMMPELWPNTAANADAAFTGPVTLYLSNNSATWTGTGAAHALCSIHGAVNCTTYQHNCTSQGTLISSNGQVIND